MTEPLLVADALVRRFGGLAAVGGVSLALRRGTLHAVIGPNGAGKSTLVNLLSGAIPPTSGRILVAGVDVTGRAPWQFARAGVGRSFQRTNVLAPMTALENVRLAAQVAATPAMGLLRTAARDPVTRRRAEAALDRVGLSDSAARSADTLSHGQLRQLEIAMVLATDPSILLLDEPLAGMGPEEAERIATLLRALARDHALLLIEHDMDVVFAVADQLTVMVDGLVLDEGPPDHIRASTKVKDAYLGHAA
jgi:branched-chain amino acid transport system ATP-binding protein